MPNSAFRGVQPKSAVPSSNDVLVSEQYAQMRQLEYWLTRGGGFSKAVEITENLFNAKLPVSITFCKLEEGDIYTAGKLKLKDDGSAEVQLSLPLIMAYYPKEAGIAAVYHFAHELTHLYLSRAIEDYLSKRTDGSALLWKIEEGICNAVGLYVTTMMFQNADASVKQIADELSRPLPRNKEASKIDNLIYLDAKEEIGRQLRELEHMSFADAINELIRRVAEGKLSLTAQFRTAVSAALLLRPEGVLAETQC